MRIVELMILTIMIRSKQVRIQMSMTNSLETTTAKKRRSTPTEAPGSPKHSEIRMAARKKRKRDRKNLPR